MTLSVRLNSGRRFCVPRKERAASGLSSEGAWGGLRLSAIFGGMEVLKHRLSAQAARREALTTFEEARGTRWRRRGKRRAGWLMAYGSQGLVIVSVLRLFCFLPCD